jgi:hypothetical protein
MHIKSPSKKEEKRLLAGMLIGLDEKPDNGLFARFKREIIGFCIGMMFVAVVLGVLRSQSLLTAFTTIGGFIVGLSVGIGARYITGVRQWPAVARCLDRTKIENRLRELDTQ